MEPSTHLICWTPSRLPAADAPVRDCLAVRPTLLPTRSKAQAVPGAGSSCKFFFVVRASDWGNRVWDHFEHYRWHIVRLPDVNRCVKASAVRCRSFRNDLDASE